jgi:arsenite methyltransferase
MHDEVKNYYGRVLQKSADLQTDACSTEEVMPEFMMKC